MSRWAIPQVILSALLLLPAAEAQSKPPPFGKIPKAKVRTVVSAGAVFQLEYPSSGNWTVLPGPPGSALVLGESKKGEALVVIERVTLTEALAPDELPTVADREARIVKEREPQARDVSHQLLDADKRKVIVVQYTRPGLQGPEQVVHYAVPQETALYRVTCTVVTAQAEKYTQWFGHIAASIQPAIPAKPKK